MNNIYFPFFPKDHLNDTNLRGCHPAAQGIWWSMVCYMAQGSPFGYLRLDPGSTDYDLKTPAEADAPAPGGPRARAGGVPGVTPRGGARARAGGVPGASAQTAYTLPPNGSIEQELPRLLGHSESLVRWAIRQLEQRQVFSRDKHGVIFCRRMVRWSEEREARQKRAHEAYRRRHGADPKHPGRKASARANGVPGGTPGAIAGGVPGGGASARARGVPSGAPLSLSTSNNPTPHPLPASGKGEHGADPVADKIARRQGAK